MKRAARAREALRPHSYLIAFRYALHCIDQVALFYAQHRCDEVGTISSAKIASASVKNFPASGAMINRVHE